MKRALMFAAAAALTLPAAAWAGGNPEAGKAKAAQVCAACHGPAGNKPSAPDQPILAGQHYDYLVRALLDYKSGKRNNPIMKGFAATLSENETANGTLPVFARFHIEAGRIKDARVFVDVRNLENVMFVLRRQDVKILVSLTVQPLKLSLKPKEFRRYTANRLVLE